MPRLVYQISPNHAQKYSWFGYSGQIDVLLNYSLNRSLPLNRVHAATMDMTYTEYKGDCSHVTIDVWVVDASNPVETLSTLKKVDDKERTLSGKNLTPDLGQHRWI